MRASVGRTPLYSLALAVLAACGAPAREASAPTTARLAEAPSDRHVASADSVPESPGAPEPVAAPEPPARAEITDEEIVAQNLPRWKPLLAQRNGVSVETVERSIKDVRPLVFTLPQGNVTFLLVRYVFAFDWLDIPVSDALPVHVARRAATPEEVVGLLSKAELLALTRQPGLATLSTPSLARLPFGQHPKFRTRAEALAAMSKGTGATFKERELDIQTPSAPGDKNEILLRWTGRLSGPSCIEVRANLSTGAITRKKEWCGAVD